MMHANARSYPVTQTELMKQTGQQISSKTVQGEM